MSCVMVTPHPLIHPQTANRKPQTVTVTHSSPAPAPFQYVLVLLNFKTPGFAPASGAGAADDPLLLEPVSIASLNALGVTPRSSHADPPAYARSGEGDYNTTVGFLENGNQRCVLPVLCWFRTRLPDEGYEERNTAVGCEVCEPGSAECERGSWWRWDGLPCSIYHHGSAPSRVPLAEAETRVLESPRGLAILSRRPCLEASHTHAEAMAFLSLLHRPSYSVQGKRRGRAATQRTRTSGPGPDRKLWTTRRC